MTIHLRAHEFTPLCGRASWTGLTNLPGVNECWECASIAGHDWPNRGICKHCDRAIALYDGAWIDPEATGDDSIWRETCDAHDTFTAEHEPEDQ